MLSIPEKCSQKASQPNANQETATTWRFHLLREHTLHGTVTGIDKVRTMASSDDKLDRLLVSFKDAKVHSILLSRVVLNPSIDCVA